MIDKKVVIKVDTGDSANDIDKLTSSVSQLYNEQNKLKENIKDLTKAYKDAKGDVDAERDANTKLSIAQTQLNTNTNQLKDAKKALSDATKNNAKEVNLEDGSIKSLRLTLNSATAEYIRLSAAQRDSASGKEMQKSIKAQSDNLKELEKQIGQNQRSVGDYELANRKLPGIFGDMQSKATEAYGAITNGISQVKGVMTDYIAAREAEKVALAASAVAAEAASVAEAELATAEATGAVTAELVATAELKRGEATVAATTATEASSAAMKIFKYALISTGVGAFVVILGSLVAYFASTNDGAKVFGRIMSGVNAVVQEGVKIIGSFGRVVADLLSGNTKALAKDWKEVKDNIENAGTSTIKNYKAAVYWKEQEQKLNKEDLKWGTEREKQQYALNLLTSKLRDTNLKPDERKKIANEAKNMTDEIYNHDKMIAERRLKIILAQEQYEAKKNPQKVEEAKRVLNKLEGDRNLYYQTILNKEAKIDKQSNAAADKALKEKEDMLKASIITINEYEQERLDLLNKIIDSDAFSTEQKLKALEQIKEKQDETFNTEKSMFVQRIDWNYLLTESDGKKVDEYLKGLGLTAKQEEEMIKVISKRFKEEQSIEDKRKKIRDEELKRKIDDNNREFNDNKLHIDSLNKLTDNINQRTLIAQKKYDEQKEGILLKYNQEEFNNEVGQQKKLEALDRIYKERKESVDKAFFSEKELTFRELRDLQLVYNKQELDAELLNFEDRKKAANGNTVLLEQIAKEEKSFKLKNNNERISIDYDYDKAKIERDKQIQSNSLNNQISTLSEGNLTILDIKQQQLDAERQLELDYLDKSVEDTAEKTKLRNEIIAKYAKSEHDIYEAKQTAILDISKTFLTGIADVYESYGGQNEIIGKGIATTEILIDTYKTGFKLWTKGAEYLTAQNYPMVAVTAAEGVALGLQSTAAINNVWKAKKTDKSASSSPNASGVSQAPIQATQQILTGTEQQLQNKSRRVIVVESDITDAQNKVKVVQDESSF